MDSWRALRLKLEREAEAIFASSGQVVIVSPDRESGSVVTLVSGPIALKLTWIPERDAVRGETDDEYSFERIPEETTLLA